MKQRDANTNKRGQPKRFVDRSVVTVYLERTDIAILEQMAEEECRSKGGMIRHLIKPVLTNYAKNKGIKDAV